MDAFLSSLLQIVLNTTKHAQQTSPSLKPNPRIFRGLYLICKYHINTISWSIFWQQVDLPGKQIHDHMHEKLELQTQSYPINPVDCLPMIHRHLKQRIALAWSLPLSAFQGYKQCRTSPAPSASDRAAEVFCIGIPNKQFYKVRYKRMWRKIMKGQGGFPCPTPSPIYVNCKHMHMYTHMHLYVLYTNTYIIATWLILLGCTRSMANCTCTPNVT